MITSTEITFFALNNNIYTSLLNFSLADIFYGLSQIGDDLVPGPDSVPIIFWKNFRYPLTFAIFVFLNYYK